MSEGLIVALMMGAGFAGMLLFWMLMLRTGKKHHHLWQLAIAVAVTANGVAAAQRQDSVGMTWLFIALTAIAAGFAIKAAAELAIQLFKARAGIRDETTPTGTGTTA